jgi:hypothetical protein
MTAQDLQEFLALIGRYYPGAFHAPSIEQVTLWADDLDAFAVTTAQEALRRWVRWYGAEPPELGDLVHLCQQVDYAAAQGRSTAAALPLERPPDQATLLQHMARLNQRMLGTWVDDAGQMHGRVTLQQAAALCRRWSVRYGQRLALAHDFAVLAGQYASLAAGEERPCAPEESR